MEQKKDRWSVVPPLMRSNFFPPIADPMGSYTGIPEDPFERRCRMRTIFDPVASMMLQCPPTGKALGQ